METSTRAWVGNIKEVLIRVLPDRVGDIEEILTIALLSRVEDVDNVAISRGPEG